MRSSKLRENLFQLLDRSLVTSEMLKIIHRGKIIKIVPPKKESKFDKLVSHPDAVNGDPEDFVHMDWSYEWNRFLDCSVIGHAT